MKRVWFRPHGSHFIKLWAVYVLVGWASIFGTSGSFAANQCEGVFQTPGRTTQRNQPVTVTVPVDIRENFMQLVFDSVARVKRSYLDVMTFDWIGDQRPVGAFFENWQEQAVTNSAILPRPGSSLFLLNYESIVATWSGVADEPGTKHILKKELTNCCDQEVLRNDDIADALINESLKLAHKNEGMTVETRYIRVHTDQGPIDSQVTSGAAHSIDATSLASQIRYLLDYASQDNRTVTGVTVRHLHPTVEFFDTKRKQTAVAFYNEVDLRTMLQISQQFPHLRIFDGATIPNGHTYQVEIINGRQVQPY